LWEFHQVYIICAVTTKTDCSHSYMTHCTLEIVVIVVVVVVVVRYIALELFTVV